MRYPPDFLDEIRSRLPASQIVGRKVRLKKQGREYVGLSPFKSERTASFFVNDAKAKWFDFAAGKNGDVFTFLMETEGLSFPEAVERLAGEAGLPLPKADAESVKREARRRTLAEIVALAAAFYRKQLAGAASVREYLTKRGIGPDLVAHFGIGYAPDDRSALKAFLAHEGVEQPDMIDAGLLVHGDDIPVSYDRFRHRVMFPIADAKGNAVGFGGRALAADVPAKYLNSPECPVFDKGRLLYNAHNAREPAWNDAPLIVVEGYADVLAVHSAGYPAAVAPMGTSLTPDQLRGLWRMADVPVLCFDGDAAGRKAARRAIDVAAPLLTRGRSLRFASLPNGLDPDDFIRKRGPEAFAGVLSRTVGLADALWAAETAGQSLSTPDDRAALLGRLQAAVAPIPDPAHRKLYDDEFRQRVSALQARPPIYRSNGHSSHSPSPGSIRLAHPLTTEGMALKDAMVVGALVVNPEVAMQTIERVVCDDSLSPEARAVVLKIAGALAELPDADAETLRAALDAAGIGEPVQAALNACDAAGIRNLAAHATAILTRH